MLVKKHQPRRIDMISRIAIIILVLVVALGCQFSMLPQEFMSTEPDMPPTDFSKTEINRTSDGAFILGNVDAPITVVVFFDYACPHCQDYHPTVSEFIEEFVVTGQARLEYRVQAFLGADSTKYAQLVECAPIVAGDDGVFPVANNLLFSYINNGRLSGDEALAQLAIDLDLSEASLAECLITADQYMTNIAFARQTGLSGVPAVRILLGTFVETDGQTPQPISPSYTSGAVDIGILRATVENAQP
jgi:hypothetical protein